MLKSLLSVYDTLLFYGSVLLLLYSPGTLAWKLFKNRKGKISFIRRDLICDTETLMSLSKNENSLDEFTTAFSPFIPLLTLNGQLWKSRRKIVAEGLRKINIDHDFKYDLPLKKGDIYWEIFEIYFHIGFELIFGRTATTLEFEEMYPGIADINRIIKRHTCCQDNNARWRLYHRVVGLLTEENQKFTFSDSLDFKALSEIDQVSIVVEDLLTSICIQCTDLVCHLLLLYPFHEEAFKHNLDNCINEALRLYPLTDIWTRKAEGNERAWIASLVQLNRSGWEDPDHFKPERWDQNDHPPLISWGFDARSCPASKIGYNLSKNFFQSLILDRNRWILPASNFQHSRTFTDGCQVLIGEGRKNPSLKWKFQGKLKNQLKQWFNSRLRVLDQSELW